MQAAICFPCVPDIRKFKRLKRIIHLPCAPMAAIMLLCIGNKASAIVGATTPFTSLEAEAGALGGGATVVSLTSAPTTPYSSPALEASGHPYVQLPTSPQYSTS